MKFKTTSGKIIGVDLRPSKWPRRDEDSCKSHFQWRIGQLIDELYPGEIVLEEFYIPGEGIYVDFFLPRKMLAVEADGSQHEAFSLFFHRTKENFLKAQARDKRKENWCEINNIKLIRVNTKEEGEFINKLKSDE